jgi:predicted ATPase
MESATGHKKEAIDFLWDWAEERGNWAKLLITKIVSGQSELDEDERTEVFQHFLKSIGFASDLPDVSITRPSFAVKVETLMLQSLSEVKAVNKLAPGQQLDFCENLNVIYGENGTGKTGYSRILKSLGFSYDNSTMVLSNLFDDSDTAKSAKIQYSVDGDAKEFIWDGSNKDSSLLNISVFNNDCVKISLADRLLIVSPVGFHLFEIVSRELDKLTSMVNSKKSDLNVPLVWSEQLHEGTPHHTFITTLTKDSSVEELTKLSAFTDSHKESLESLEKGLKELNKGLIEQNIKICSAQKNELAALNTRLIKLNEFISTAQLEKYTKANARIEELRKTVSRGLADIVQSKGVAAFDSVEFQSFLESADAYISILENSDYPNPDDVCIYCRQPLTDEAHKLLTSYRKLLGDKSKEEIQTITQWKKEFVESVVRQAQPFVLHQSTFGTDDRGNAIQPEEIQQFNTSLKEGVKLLESEEFTPKDTLGIDVEGVTQFISSALERIEKILADQQEKLTQLNPEERDLQRKLAALKDQKLLSQNVESVKTRINSLKAIDLLRRGEQHLSTRAISIRTSSARDELVSKNFNERFENELKALRKSGLGVELSFGTDRGKSKVYHRIKNHQVLEVLSEGEQKAISLAEFLTELQLDPSQSPVIFDDPVNSLDHKIIDEVAKRLVELSKTRQVIVFTHSILLLNSFIQQKDLDFNKDLQTAFVRVRNNFNSTGIVDEVEEINSYGYYSGKLNVLLQHANGQQDEEKVAAEGYGYLRSAIEVTVEDLLFQKTIRRYHRGVAFPSLMRVKGAQIDEVKPKLNDIYEKCCESINGHSSPDGLSKTPSVSELQQDYTDFKELRKQFT